MSRITRLNPGVGSSTPAYVFDITKYGAAGDGKIVTDGAMTSGSATLTSATANFTAADVGKPILVKNAAINGVTTLSTTITGFTNSTTVTLGANAGNTVSNAWILWATDDTTAIQSAVNAAVTYAQAHSGYAEVFTPAASGAFYMIAGALQTGGTTKGNSQITIPPVAVAVNKVTLVFKGVENGSAQFHWQQATATLNGSTWVSTGLFSGISAQANNVSANSNPAVLGGPNQTGGYGVGTLLYSNMLVTLKGMTILTPYSSFGLNYCAVDFSGLAQANIFDCSFGVPSYYGELQSPNALSSGQSIGVLMPANGNNDNNAMRNVTLIGGYTWGLLATEHTVINALRILYCWAALVVSGTYLNSVGASHAVTVDGFSCEGCIRHVYLVGSGQSGVGPTISIAQLDTEGNPILYDASNGGTGGFGLGDVAYTGFNPVSVPNPTGVKLKNLIQQPGYVATPSYTLGTAFINPFWRDATVTITGGTVTGIKVGKPAAGVACLGGTTAPAMQSLGVTSGTVRVPSGGWLEIDGSVAPTCTWMLD